MDTNANEDVNEAKGTKNASKWLKKASQDTNIEANYDLRGNLTQGSKETTRKGLMSYYQRSDQKRE